MSACIFVGPTLPTGDEPGGLAAVWLPPAKHGDVYRAVSLLRPRAIGIIDGYFQWTPSVWHKEILWALQQGVHVFGAASMGALRAAELAAFGMRGVGRIYEAYRDGALAGCGDEPFEDDDEVAVVHGPADSGYLAASEAMVNIRCTLVDARTAGVIDEAVQAQLGALAKALYFPDRSYERLFERARQDGLPDGQLAALREWLPAGRVNQKRADALAMLEAMRRFLAQDPAPLQADFAFEHTSLWERALATGRPKTLYDAQEARVIEELRLDGARWEMRREEVLRALTAAAAGEGTAAPGQLTRRLNEHRGRPHEIERVLEEAAGWVAARRMRGEIPRALVEHQILARIRGTGEFEQLRARAEDKRTRLATRADLPEVEAFSELQLLELRDWYFSRVLGRDMPDDLEQHVDAGGYTDLTHFHRVIFAEYVYRQMTNGEGDTMRRRSGDGGSQR